MARPCKSAKVLTECSQTKAELEKRKKREDELRGKKTYLRPPSYLNKSQKAIFEKIKRELKDSNILGNLDVYILSQCAIAIDRIQYIESTINICPELLNDGKFMAAKEKYIREFFRCCNELSLSPQSRAKMANLNLQAEKDREDPLLQALKEEDEEGGEVEKKTG